MSLPHPPRRRRALLASTAFTGAFIAVIAGHPQSALAACQGVNTGNILCDAANQATAGTLNTTFAGTTVLNVNPGAKIDTGGAAATVTATGDLTFNNNDTTFGITNLGLGGVRLRNDFGSITYLGNANVTSTVAPSEAISAGINAGAGNISVTNNGTVTGPDGGIVVFHGGTGNMLVQGTGAVTAATAITAQHFGIGPAAGTNGIAITGSGNLAGIGGLGIFATINNVGNASNILIDWSGPVAGSFQSGIWATTNGAGKITVAGSGPVTGVDTVSNTAVSGIRATQTNNAVGGNGGVTVSGSGNINATGIGIDAQVTGANNKGSVTVDRTGNVSATGMGINALANGGGDVTVSGVGNVSSSGNFGIQAVASGGNGNVLVAPTGTVSGVTRGISVSAAGSGTSTVVLANNVTSTGTGVAATGGGDINITQNAGAVVASASALQALSSGGAGAINITTAAGTAASGGITILAHNFGTGDVNVTSGGTVTAVNDGIQARIFNGASAGNVSVNVAAGSAISANFSGVLAVNSGSGKIDATVGAGATVTGGAGHFGFSLFGGGTNTLTNSGTISGGSGGVEMAGTGGTVTNFGSIIGAGGGAVRLTGASNLFVMSGPGATLTGNAFGSGTDTFRFAGSGSNSFNVAQISTGWTLLDKTGSSNWTLTGTSTYAGPVTVNGGTLSVNGNLTSASSITVNSGGTLGGTGTVGNTTINAGGALAPGNSIGTITISGNLSFVGAGNYVVEVSGAASDKTVVSGTATLGGTVQVVPLTRVTTRTTYTILSGSPVSGTFGSAAVQNNFARNAVLSYVGNDVLLTLDPGLLAPSLVGGTPNQRAVAGAVDTALAGGNALSAFDPLFGLSASQLPGALDQLSGEVHASTAGVLADESLYARSAILGRLRQASYGGSASMAALSTGGPQAFAAEGSEAIEGALAYGKSPVMKAPLRAPAATSDIVFWAQGFGAWGRYNGDGNATTVRRDLAGFFTGIDTRVGDAGRIGIAAGYTGSKNNLDGRGGANVETAHIAGYGGWSFGALTLRAGGDVAFHSIATDRTINFPGFFDRTFANYDGHTGQIFGELGYGFALANVAIEPFAGAAWVRVKTDGTAERGGAAALAVAGTTFETGYTTLGIRAAGMVPIGPDMILIPRGTLAWQHAFDDVTPNAALAFQVAPAAAFTISGVPIARDALLAEAALDLAIGRNATVGISYTGQIANNVTDHAAKGRFSWRF